MYDKANSLRIETTINDPSDFKVYGEVHHKDGTVSKQWKPMGKAISNLYRYAEISKLSNKRYIHALTNIIPIKSTQEEIETVCGHVKEKKKIYTGFNVWDKETFHILTTIAAGKYLLTGFTNKSIREELYPQTYKNQKTVGKTTRLLKKLRVHKLIRKVPHSQKYFVTDKGRRIVNALIEMKYEYYPKAIENLKSNKTSDNQAS